MDIKLSNKIISIIKDAFNTNNEVAGWAIGSIKGHDITIKEFDLKEFKELGASTFEPKESFKDKNKVLLSVHFHSRKYGDTIEVYDPYWTVTQKESNKDKGSIINNEFYISRLHDKGDSDTLEVLSNKLRKEKNLNIKGALFIHPKYGSQDKLMTNKLIQLTCYAYDPNSKFRVSKLCVQDLF
jgi:hypothetical protein